MDKDKLLNDYLDYVKNFKVKNKSTYSISTKKENDERLDDLNNIKYSINYFLNVRDFYNRPKYYRHNQMASIAEFYCRYLDYDGILIKVKDTDDINHKLTEFDFQNITLHILSYDAIYEEYFPESELLTSHYTINIIRELYHMKRLELDSYFINGYECSDISIYMFYINTMINCLKIYYKNENKEYIYNDKTILEFFITYKLFISLYTFIITYKNLFIISNFKKFVHCLLNYAYKYAIGTKENPITFNILKNNLDFIKNDFIEIFSKTEKGINIINSFNNFNLNEFENYFKQAQNELIKICNDVTKKYFIHTSQFLNQEEITSLEEIKKEKGNSYLIYMIESLYFKSCNSDIAYSYYKDLYNKHYYN